MFWGLERACEGFEVFQGLGFWVLDCSIVLLPRGLARLEAGPTRPVLGALWGCRAGAERLPGCGSQPC